MANNFLLRSLVAGGQAIDLNINKLNNIKIAVLKQQNLVFTIKLTSIKLTLD